MKITMYELLGMVKDGKAPNKIKYNDYIYTVKGNAIECFVDYCSEEDEWCFNHYVRYENLNDTVEILEEEKKIPEKLDGFRFKKETDDLTDEECEVENYLSDVTDKINEIIDYLKSKGDE